MKLFRDVDNLFEQALNRFNELPSDIKRVMLPMSTFPYEQIRYIFLKDDKLVSGKYQDSPKGEHSRVKFDFKDIVSRAKVHAADEVIMVHNHPGETSTASKSDIDAARDIKNYLKDKGLKIRFFIVAGNKTGKQASNVEDLVAHEYDENTDPSEHHEDFIQRAKEVIDELNSKLKDKTKQVKIGDDELREMLKNVNSFKEFLPKFNKLIKHTGFTYDVLDAFKGAENNG